MKVLSLLVLAAGMFFAPSTDNFTRADDPTGLGANWTCASGSAHFNINTNRAQDNPVTGSNTVWCNYTATTPSADHYSQVHVTGTVGTTEGGPTVRWTGTSAVDATGYAVFGLASGTVSLVRKDAGTDNYTLIHNFTSAWSDGDLLKLSVVGSSLTVSVNGTPLASQTDATYATGTYGIASYDPVAGDIFMTLWQGDQNGGGGAVFPAAIINTPIKCCTLPFGLK